MCFIVYLGCLPLFASFLVWIEQGWIDLLCLLVAYGVSGFALHVGLIDYSLLKCFHYYFVLFWMRLRVLVIACW